MASESALFVLFDQASEIADPTERAAFLDRACEGQYELREQVDSLLSDAEDVSEEFLEKPAFVQSGELNFMSNDTARAMPAGSAVGPYKLVRLIGEGGMGSVFLAEQEQPVKRRVALKIVRPGMDSAQVLARFDAERQALATMDHPSIARVFDAGSTSAGLPYFVMELVLGEPITTYCDANALSVLDRLRLFGQVCAAIQHAHQNGLIHRDIKPSNVLVTEVDGKPVPKIIDFGIAKAFAGKLTEQALMTQAGAIFGTLEYMSPEQAEGGTGGVDTRSDVYSLGVLLYELLTGTPPIDLGWLQQPALSEVLRTIREKDPPRPSARVTASNDAAKIALQRASIPPKLVRQMHGELDWIVLKALDKDRARRYQSPTAFAADIENFIGNKPVAACPPSQLYLFTKWVARNRAACIAGGLVAAAVLAGLCVSTFLYLRERAERERATVAEALAHKQREIADAARVRASEEAANANAVNAFLRLDLLNQVSPWSQASGTLGDPNKITLRSVLDRAAEHIEGRFPGQPLVEAAIRQTIGYTYQGIGEYALAQKHLEAAVASMRKLLGEYDEKTVLAERELVVLYCAIGQSKKGAAMLQPAADYYAQIKAPTDPALFGLQSLLALAYLNSGELDKSEALCNKVIAVLNEKADIEGVAATLMNVYVARGDFAKAVVLGLRIWESNVKFAGRDNAHTVVCEHRLAYLYAQVKNYELAETHMLGAIEGFKKSLGENSVEALYAQSDLAQIFIEGGQKEEATVALTALLPQAIKKFGENHSLPQSIRDRLKDLQK